MFTQSFPYIYPPGAQTPPSYDTYSFIVLFRGLFCKGGGEKFNLYTQGRAAARFFYFSSKPSGLRCPVFAAGDGAPLQKADRVPLALSQFSRRAAERPCENWSAAPAAAPCFVHRTRSPPLPLLRFGCFCRRQRLSSAAPSGPAQRPTGQAARTAPEAKAYDFIIYLNPPAAL